MTRKECLEQAAKCVLQNRQDQYGDVEDCFKKIARLWNAYLPSTIELEPFDVACMMALLKIARIQANPKHGDSWVDLAGYAACGADIAIPEPFRYDRPEAESGCFRNGNGHSPEVPEFKPGDKVQIRVTLPSVSDRIWVDGTYARYDRGCAFPHAVYNDAGHEENVQEEDIRPAPKAEAEPEFKPGDKVQFCQFPHADVWLDGIVERVEGCHCFIRRSNGVEVSAPKRLIRRPCAEGCEALVEKDAPQTKEELFNRIVDCNPSVYPHKPTGEELAEEEPHG